MKLRLLAAVTAALLLAPAWAQEGDVMQELEKFAGTWKPTKFESADREARPEKFVAKLRLVFQGETMKTLSDGTELDRTTFKIDPGKSPKHMDIVSSKGPNKGKISEAIYTFEGGALKLCIAQPGEPRPKAFKSEKGSKTEVITLERDKN